MISVIYGLKFEKNENKSVLLIEFNPEMYEKLFYEIKNLGMEVVLINSRRSSVWSKKSISILKKTQAKIITLSDFLEKKDNKTIIKKSEFLREEFLKIFENENSLKQIFSINGISFWEIIKKQVISMYLSRIVERLSYVLIAKKLFNEKKFSSILSLNLSGESEKVFTNSKYTSIMLQHAFGNYSKEIKSLEMTDDLNLIKGKIAVWGDVIKNYLLDNYNISEENIIVSGSPRHDLFFEEQKVNDNELILLTPRPIINDIVGEDTKKYELYEETIKRIITAVENSKSKLVVKLHPQKNQHNNDIKDMIQKINPEIEIYQDVSILELLKKCKLMINLSPDNYDASTTILEAMIMKKPVLDVTLEKKRFGFEFLKDKAIETLDFESDIENLIFEIITNQNKHKDLIKNSQIHLRKYLANQGNASKILAENL